MSKATYLRFLQLVSTLQGDSVGISVDLTALRLLEAVAVAHANGSALTVTKAMSLNNIASPATLHRKLTALLDANYIEFEFVGKNRRTKYVVPTKNAAQYFSKLGNALAAAANGA
jgi:DNA-binding MarR family transcriptional regulator